MVIVESQAPERSERGRHPKQHDQMTLYILYVIIERDRLKAAGFCNEARVLRSKVAGHRRLITQKHSIKKITEITTKQAVGIGAISCGVLQPAAFAIVKPARKMTNKSFTSRKIPAVWITTKVTSHVWSPKKFP